MDPSSPSLVLDTWAIMAHLLDEPEGAHVRTLIAKARTEERRLLISGMSLGEIAYTIERRRGVESAKAVLGALDDLGIEIIDPDRETILRAAGVKARHPISFGDAFVVALACEEGATIVTGDPEFRRVEHLVAVCWLGST